MLFVLIEDVFPYQFYVCMYVCMYGRYCPYTWARRVVEKMKFWQLILIVSIVKILVWKPNSFLVFLFILITLVSLHNTHVLNYIRNIKKIAYRTLKNILKPIFKVVTKQGKMKLYIKRLIMKIKLKFVLDFMLFLYCQH